MDRWILKVAIVTGASSGIGCALVEKLVTEGMVVSHKYIFSEFQNRSICCWNVNPSLVV